MSLVHDIGREMVKALVVLALIFLSLTHQAVASTAAQFDGFAVSVTELSICSQGHDSASSDHPSCHASKISPADLPPPPCDAQPAFAENAVRYTPLRHSDVVAQVDNLLPETRAPPILA